MDVVTLALAKKYAATIEIEGITDAQLFAVKEDDETEQEGNNEVHS